MLNEVPENERENVEKIFRDVTLDERAWVEKRSRELAEHTRASEIYQAREDGMEQGLKQGIEQGRSEGFAEGEKIGEERGEASGRAAEKVEMARAMKNKDYSVEEISELTGLSVEEIEKL